MIKTTKVIDVQSVNDAIVYDLLFACVETEGNDKSYEIYPFEWEPNDWTEKMWKRRKSSENLSLQGAIYYFHKWLKDNKIDEFDDLMVKIWW